MNGQIFALIRTRYNTLSQSQRAVADYILENPEQVIGNTLSDTADACRVSEPTILRFLRKIGFTSYQLFKINLAQELPNKAAKEVYEDVTFDDTYEQIIEKIMHSVISSIQDSRETIRPDTVARAVEKIMQAGKVLVVGVGASAAVAADLYHKLLKLKINAVCSNDSHIMNILSINLESGDLVIAISHSGESREILDAVSLAKEQLCEVCAITSYEKSTLANRADFVLCSSSLETKFRSDAMTSRIIQIMIIDIIYVCIVTKMGEGILPQVLRSRLAVAKNKV